MKKNIFILLVLILVVLILIYFYDKRERIINKKYVNNKVYIEYPYFNNIDIDLYINNYLNNIINIDNNKYFIDYDYKKNSNSIDLVIYKYKYSSNIIKEDVYNFVIYPNLNSIKRANKNFYQKNNLIKTKKIKGKYKISLVFVGNEYNYKINNILDKYNIMATFYNNDNIYYTFDSLDYKYHNSSYISNNIINNVHDGDIILMHSIYSATVNSLELIIPSLLNMGYTFVDVNELSL